MKMKKRMEGGKGEKGTALVITLMTLAILIIIGLAALMTSSLDLRITGNEQIQKKAFYAADAGVNYVQYKFDFYSRVGQSGQYEFRMSNLTANAAEDKSKFDSAGIDFEGTVSYRESGPIPETPLFFGTDYSAHHFVIDCTGKLKDSDQAKADLRLHGWIPAQRNK
jgi:hypothetical protein